MIAFLRRLFCRHHELTAEPTGEAIIGEGTVLIAAVEIRCVGCGEFWHVDLDASEAVGMALGLEVSDEARLGPRRIA